MTTAGIVLAAGGGSRFHGPAHKLLTEFRGRPIVASVIEAATHAHFDAVAVVMGCVDLSDLCPPRVVLLKNPNWASGLASSLQVGLAWAEQAGHDVAVVGLGDSPGIPADAWERVGHATADIAVAQFGDENRPPVRLARAVWNDVPTEGDAGARSLWNRPGTVSVPCEGDATDIDTTEDLVAMSATLKETPHES